MSTEQPKRNKSAPREPMPQQDPEVRVTNFDEVPLGYSPLQAVSEAQRCLQCKKPFCEDGCPVNAAIPAILGLVAEGRFAEAARKVKETNCLPAVCGRVCPQETQCEATCILGRKYEPIAIGRLERFVADYEREHQLTEIPALPPPTSTSTCRVKTTELVAKLLATTCCTFLRELSTAYPTNSGETRCSTACRTWARQPVERCSDSTGCPQISSHLQLLGIHSPYSIASVVEGAR